MLKKGKKVERGLLFGAFLTLMFFARLLLEFTKEHQAEYAGILPLNLGALLSLPPMVFGCWLIWQAKRKPLAEPVSVDK